MATTLELIGSNFKNLLDCYSINTNLIKQHYHCASDIIGHGLKKRKRDFKDPIKITKIINKACRSRYIYKLKNK